MKNNTLISVIIPVYNTGKEGYLNRCLNSVLNSTYNNLEIICVNDGSTDNSLEILKQYQSHDSRISIINKENAGVSMARNSGIDNSHGEFISFIDSDDWIDKRYYQNLVEYAETERADLVICGYVEKEAGGVISEQENEFFNERGYKVISGKDFFGSNVEAWVRGFIWGRLYRRKLIGNKRFSTELSVMEDNMFNIDVLSGAISSKIVLLDRKMYFRFNRPGSLSQSLDSNEWIDLSKRFIEKTIQKAQELPDCSKKYLLFETFKKSLRLRWHVMFYPKNVKMDVNLIVKMNYMRLIQLENISLKERVYFYVLCKFPQVYRAYLIHNDKSFLEAEKRKRKKCKKSNS